MVDIAEILYRRTLSIHYRSSSSANTNILRATFQHTTFPPSQPATLVQQRVLTRASQKWLVLHLPIFHLHIVSMTKMTFSIIVIPFTIGGSVVVPNDHAKLRNPGTFMRQFLGEHQAPWQAPPCSSKSVQPVPR